MIHAQHTLIATALTTALTTALITGLAACGGSGGGTGTLNLNITDAPVDSAEHVYVEFTGVEIKAANGETVDITYNQPKQLDLLALTGGVAEVLVENQLLPAGQVEWIRLKVNASQGGDPADDSYIVINGTPYELRIPSGDQTGLKLNRPVTIEDGGVASFTIDFDLRKSVHERSGDIYNLRPTLRLVDNHTDGALAGTVDLATITANCIAGDDAAVYVFAGSNVTPDDINIDGNNVEPVATASVDWEGMDNDYSVAFLSEGDYTVAFTCDAGEDDPAADNTLTFVGTSNVTVNAGQTTVKNF